MESRTSDAKDEIKKLEPTVTHQLPSPSFRHAAPSVPWPWVDIDDEISAAQTNLMDGGALPIPELCDHKHCRDCWTGYPESRFPNWTVSQVKKSRVAAAIEQEQYTDCISYTFDIDDSGYFKNANAFVAEPGKAGETWKRILDIKRPSYSKTRAIFIKDLSGPMLQMLGTRYNIEPFFFSSSLNWIPSRFQEDMQHGVGDHITITLTFLRSVSTQRISDFKAATRPYSGPFNDGGGAADNNVPQSSPFAEAIDTKAPLKLRYNESYLCLDLLSIHLIRNVEGNTIISYHPSPDLPTTGAQELYNRIIFAGQSVYWRKLFQESSDPTLLLLTYLWYALHSWDQALDNLYNDICQFESQVIDTDQWKITQDLHIIRAHQLHYTALLDDFRKTVEFIRKHENPAMSSNIFTERDKELSKKILDRECDNLIHEIDRLVKDLLMQERQLENVMSLVFCSVNISDSKLMREMTGAATKESAAMKQIAHLTMVFLPTSVVAGLFGMNTHGLSPGTNGSLQIFGTFTFLLTLLTFWTIIAFQSRHLLGDMPSILRQRYRTLVSSFEWRRMIRSVDLRKHCSTIFDKTIANTDIHQNGSTKKFFRAGTLAVPEPPPLDRLDVKVTFVQKNIRRRMAMKKYRELRQATIKIQIWWRDILAKRLAENVRREVAARKLQTAISAFIQGKRFLDVGRSVILLQSRIRGIQARHRFVNDRQYQAATLLQSLLRGVSSRRSYRSDVHHVVYMQSCIRRRYARRELKVLRGEVLSLSEYQEDFDGLENNAVETRFAGLERQLQQWMNKHEESDLRLKQALVNLQTTENELAHKEELLQAKLETEKMLEDVVSRLVEKEETILKLTDEISQQATQIEAQQKALEAAPVRTHEDNLIITTLKNEVSNLREQLNRANALNVLTKSLRADQPPLSPTFAPTLCTAEQNGATNGSTAANNRHQRRHSSAVVFGLMPQDNRTSTDEVMINVKESQATNPRAVSVAFNGEDNFMRFRNANGLPGIRDYEDPVEEKIRLMMEAKKLDEDVLDGLVRGLKIPMPSLTNPSAVNEILFPANLISSVMNEMWKYGLIAESERFLANVMQTIQAHVMSFQGEDAIVPGIFWLSNVHEMLSFICVAESDMLQGVGPGEENAVRPFDWADYERLISVIKHDMDSLEYDIYHTWMLETKKKLSKMVIPALIESQSLPGFTTSDGGGRLSNRLLNTNTQPAFSMDDILNLLSKVWKSLKSYYMEESVVQQVITELLKLIGVTSFNDLLMRRNFASWKRAMQIQYNITRIEEWCKSHDMPEGTLQLEHLMQATKLLTLKKATPADIEIIFDVCWMLSPMQIQIMCTNYYVADYENPISPEILRVVASRVQANDRNDHVLLSPETEEVGPYELPLPRDVSGLQTHVPAYLDVSHLRRLAALIS